MTGQSLITKPGHFWALYQLCSSPSGDRASSKKPCWTSYKAEQLNAFPGSHVTWLLRSCPLSNAPSFSLFILMNIYLHNIFLLGRNRAMQKCFYEMYSQMKSFPRAVEVLTCFKFTDPKLHTEWFQHASISPHTRYWHNTINPMHKDVLSWIPFTAT